MPAQYDASRVAAARRLPHAVPFTSSEPEGAGSGPASPFSPAYTRYALGLLLVVYIFNFIDRQIVSILLPAIKEHLGLSGTQPGFFSGTSFAIFHSTLGIPIARYSDGAR